MNVCRGIAQCLIIVGSICSCVFADGWKFGTGRTLITPKRPMVMSGYASRDRPCDEKLTDLWAKALVLEDGAGQRVCWVTVDLIGVSKDLTDAVAARIQQEHGIERQQFMISASHTHTGPALANTLVPMYAVVSTPSQIAEIEAYTESVKEQLVHIIGDAVGSLREGQLHWGHGVATFGTNRRNNRPEGEVPHRRRVGKLSGPIDHDVPVLSVRDAAGDLRAVVFGYACHATVLSSYQWSGDYPGFAQLELEAEHPGCQAMFWAGCGADQNPLPRRSVALARHYGKHLATAVERVLLTTEMEAIDPQLTAKFKNIELAFDELPDESQLKADLESRDRFVAGRAGMLLDQIASGKPLAKHYPYPISVWHLGNQVQLIGLGGEVVVDFSVRLKHELQQQRTWIAAYSNDVMAYIPSRRVWDEGGYEGGGAMVYYGLPTRWAPDVEVEIVQAVKELAAAKDGARDESLD